MATNYERCFGTPEKLTDTFMPNGGDCCLMEYLGYDCTNDAAVVTRCPLYNRMGACKQNILEWLQEEALDD